MENSSPWESPNLGELELEVPPLPAKGFRVNAKRFFVTYPQCDITPANLLGHFKTLGLVTRYVIGQEEHKDGGKHLHAVVEYAQKMNIKDSRFFDMNGFHPNFQGVKNWSQSSAYCKKDGNYIEEVSFDDSTPDNYRKRKADMKAWSNDKAAKARTDVVWPIALPDGSTHHPLGKKRHLWIVGPADSGKSTWAMNTFDGMKVFLRSPTKYPFEGYQGEEVIIYDDIYPTQEEWLNVSMTHWNNMHVFGDTRYEQVVWPNKKDLTMIVLSNILPNYNNVEAFNARFIVINMQAQ